MFYLFKGWLSMILNVAVVEDDIKIFEGLKGYLNKFSKSADVQINLHYFPDALKFLNDYRPVYNLVFMDINLPRNINLGV